MECRQNRARCCGARRRPRQQALGALLIGALLLGMLTPPATAEPLLGVLKNTLLGGATGLVLGGTATLVVDDEDDRSGVVRWGIVIGTFAGFSLGVALAVRGEEDLFATQAEDSEFQQRIAATLALAAAHDAATSPRVVPRCMAPSGASAAEPAGLTRLRIPLLSVQG